MNRFLISALSLTLLLAACDSAPYKLDKSEVPGSLHSEAPAGSGVSSIDWTGLDGEELCGGEFIVRVSGLYPEPDYDWIFVSVREIDCDGVTIVNSLVANEYGVGDRKFKTDILNINDYSVGSQTIAVFAGWYASGWEGRACSAYNPIGVFECPGGGDGGGGKGGPDPQG